MEESKSIPKSKPKAILKPLGSTSDLQKKMLLKKQLDAKNPSPSERKDLPFLSPTTPLDISYVDSPSIEPNEQNPLKIISPPHQSKYKPLKTPIPLKMEEIEEESTSVGNSTPQSPLLSGDEDEEKLKQEKITSLETPTEEIKVYKNVSISTDLLSSSPNEKSLFKPVSLFKPKKQISFLDFLKEDYIEEAQSGSLDTIKTPTVIEPLRKSGQLRKSDSFDSPGSKERVKNFLGNILNKPKDDTDSPITFINTSIPTILETYVEEELEKENPPIEDLLVEDELLKISESFVDVIYKEEIDEEEIKLDNPLYEEEYYSLNELYEEEIIVNNPLLEEEILTENVLHSDKKDILKDFNISLEKLRIGIFREKTPPYIDSFTGTTLVNYIINLTDYCLSREEVIIFAQELMNHFVFKNVNLHKKFEDSKNSYYKFAEEIESGFPHPFKNYQPLENQYYVLRDIDLLFQTVVTKYSPLPTQFPYKNLLDYILIGKSPEFKELRKNLNKLYKVNLLSLHPDHRKTFFINIFNILCLVGITGDTKRRASVMKMSITQKNIKLVVGNYQFSPELIEKTILNGKKHDLSIPFDPRFLFCIHKGTMSCPSLRYYNYQNIEQDLHDSTSDYLKNNLKILENEKTVSLPVYFIRKEFGINAEEKKEFLKKYGYVDIPEDYKITYQEFDYNLNQKDLETSIQDLKIEFHEIIQNPKYRQHFKNFCEKEYSQENIEAWTEIINYQKTNDPMMRRSKAKDFVQDYLEKGAKKELNVSDILKKKVFKIIEEDDAICSYANEENYVPNYPKKLFDDIKNHIEDIMVDTFTRFKKTDYNQLAKEILESPIEVLDLNDVEEPQSSSFRTTFSYKSRESTF